MENKDKNPDSKFKIRLEARLKNDALISAREKLNLNQKVVAAAIGMTHTKYGDVERMQYYPPEDLQRQIVDFYQEYGITLKQEDIFPSQLKKQDLARNM